MAPGDRERPDRPEYNVYRAGSKGLGRGRRAEPKPSEQAGASGEGASDKAPSEGPDGRTGAVRPEARVRQG